MYDQKQSSHEVGMQEWEARIYRWCGCTYLKGGSSDLDPSGSSGFVCHRLKYFLHFYLKVQDYLRRFESIPDMLELDHLTVSGDVTFGKNVSLKVL